jgi:hypothetical protein
MRFYTDNLIRYEGFMGAVEVCSSLFDFIPGLEGLMANSDNRTRKMASTSGVNRGKIQRSTRLSFSLPQDFLLSFWSTQPEARFVGCR